jgi:hypothetical protein
MLIGLAASKLLLTDKQSHADDLRSDYSVAQQRPGKGAVPSRRTQRFSPLN